MPVLDWRTILLVPAGVICSALLCLWLAQNLSERAVRSQQRLVLLEQRDRLAADLASQVKRHRDIAQWLAAKTRSRSEPRLVSATWLRSLLSTAPLAHRPAGITVVRMPEAKVVTTDDPMLKTEQVLSAKEVLAALEAKGDAKPVAAVGGDTIDIWIARTLPGDTGHWLLIRAELKLPATDAMRTSFISKPLGAEHASNADRIAEVTITDTAQYSIMGFLNETTPPTQFQYRTDMQTENADFWGLTSRLLAGSGLLAVLLGALAWRWHVHRRNEREAQIWRHVKESGAALAESVTKITRSGDLTQAIHADHRALEPVAHAINGLNKLALQRSNQSEGAAREVTQSVAQLRTSAAEMTELSLKHQEVLNLALDRLTQAVNSVDEIASVSKRANASVREVSAESSSSAQAAGEVVTGLGAVREQVRQSEKRVKGLGERVQEISQAVKKVAELSDRTGILALNASLQAAAAGPAGREFAVLADEVKRLSDSAGSTTNQIGSLVGAIHDESAQALKAIDAAIEQVVSASAQASKSAASIQASNGQLDAMIQEINGLTRIIDLQAGAGRALSSHVERVDQYNDQLRKLIANQARQIGVTGTQAQRLLDDSPSVPGSSTS